MALPHEEYVRMLAYRDVRDGMRAHWSAVAAARNK